MTKKINDLDLPSADKAILHRFVKSWQDHGHPVLFAGAGLSAFNSEANPRVLTKHKFGTWADISRAFKEQLTNHDPTELKGLPDDPLRLAQIYESEFGRTALLDVVDEFVPSDAFLPGEAHRQLAKLPWHAVVTTNYDTLLERTFDLRVVRRVVTDTDLTQRRSPGDLLLVKMHGDIGQRDSIVLSEDDYREYGRRHAGLTVKIRQLLLEHPLLFLGFSLSDPNFAKIDGWIRDSVGKVRLPAIAIMHSDSPGERNMWRARGVECINVKKSLNHLLSALITEQIATTKKDNAPQLDTTPASLLESKAKAIVTSATDNKEQQLAELINTGARQLDSDNLRSFVRAFANGWQWVVNPDSFKDLLDQAKPLVDLALVFGALEEQSRIAILLTAMQLGIHSLKIPNQPIVCRDELASKYDKLPVEKKAEFHLYSAKELLSSNQHVEAGREIRVGRKLALPVWLAEAFTQLERERTFLFGQQDDVNAELRRPLDNQNDVFAMCRRGADCLLMGQKAEAQRWYKTAQEWASTGDERYSAIWGAFAANFEAGNGAATLDALREIPESERPRSVKAFELREKAGDWLVSHPNQAARAVDSLEEFVEAARSLGWPHSPAHNLSLPIETAIKHATGLLLASAGATTPAEDIKRAIELLIRYGLATHTKGILKTKHFEKLASNSLDVDWFRSLVEKRPVFPRALEAQLVIAAAGIPLLRDDQISQVVADVLKLQNSINKNDDRGSNQVAEASLSYVIKNREHLDQSAASMVMNFLVTELPRTNRRRRQLWALHPSLWLQMGYFAPGDQTMERLAESLNESLRLAFKAEDPFWQNEVSDYLWDFHSSGCFTEKEESTIAKQVAAIVKDDPQSKKRQGILSLVGLLAKLDPCDSERGRQAFAPVALLEIRKRHNSSDLALSIDAATASLQEMTNEQQREIEGELLRLSQSPEVSDFQKGKMLAIAKFWFVNNHEWPARKRIPEAHFDRLATLDFAAIQFAAQSRQNIALAVSKLLSSNEKRVTDIQSIAAWIQKSGKANIEVLERLSALIMVDDSITRLVTVRAMTAVASVPRANAELRKRAANTIWFVADFDESPLLRASALKALSEFPAKIAPQARLRQAALKARNSNWALERRFADFLLLSLNKRPRRTRAKSQGR